MAEISCSFHNRTEAGKRVSAQQVIRFLKEIERGYGWRISEMIRALRERQADSFSVNKDNPDGTLFIRRGYENVSIIIRQEKGEVKASIPISEFDALYPSV